MMYDKKKTHTHKITISIKFNLEIDFLFFYFLTIDFQFLGIPIFSVKMFKSITACIQMAWVAPFNRL